MVTMYGFTVREPKSIKSYKISSYYLLKYEFSSTHLINKLLSHKVQLLNCLCTTITYKLVSNIILFCCNIFVITGLLHKTNFNSLYNYFSIKKEQKILIIYITYCYNLSSLWLSESKEILLSHCSSVIICNESKFITNQSNNWYLYRCNIDRSIHSPGKMLQAYQNTPIKVSRSSWYRNCQSFMCITLNDQKDKGATRSP